MPFSLSPFSFSFFSPPSQHYHCGAECFPALLEPNSTPWHNQWTTPAEELHEGVLPGVHFTYVAPKLFCNYHHSGRLKRKEGKGCNIITLGGAISQGAPITGKTGFITFKLSTRKVLFLLFFSLFFSFDLVQQAELFQCGASYSPKLYNLTRKM